MSDGRRRHRTPQEKLQIVEEARRGGLSVSEVCRKHGVAPTAFYEWEQRIREGSLTNLQRDEPRRRLTKAEELEAEIARLKGVIAEIAEENLRLKKGLWS
jgi:transposase-like protein